MKSYGNYQDHNDPIDIVMEYMPDGDLGHYINAQWSESDTKFFAKQVLHALRFMHYNRVVHRDIKLFVSCANQTIVSLVQYLLICIHILIYTLT